MEKTTHKITSEINNLIFFKPLLSYYDSFEILGDLEITPFKGFKAEYGNIYWFFHYLILKEGKVVVEKEELEGEYKFFFTETEVNFEWIKIHSTSNFEIKCIDGRWTVDVYNKDLNKVVESLNV